MIIVNFTRNPAANLWIGWAEYMNGTYFASGHTMDNLVHRMKAMLYNKKRVSASLVWLNTKQSTIDEVPIHLMTNMFRTKYWFSEKSSAKKPAVQKPATEKTSSTKEPNNVKYDYYEYKVKDGRLVVYGVLRREINSFDLRKNQIEGGENGGNE